MEWLIGYLSSNKCRNAAVEDSLPKKGLRGIHPYIHFTPPFVILITMTLANIFVAC